MIRSAAVFVLLFVSSPLLAQSAVDGTWDFIMSSPFGAVNAKVTLQADGSDLSGEFDLGDGRKLEIQDGVVDGDKIAFSITREGMMTMTYEMTASVADDSITGTAAAMGTTAPWSMKRGS